MSNELPADSQGKMIVFGAKQIRRTWHEEQWFFSVVDIIAALTDSDNPRNYWNMMKAREQKQSDVQLSTLCVQLKLTSSDGKTYRTDCVNEELRNFVAEGELSTLCRQLDAKPSRLRQMKRDLRRLRSGLRLSPLGMTA